MSFFLLTNEEASQSNHMAPPEEEDPHREKSGIGHFLSKGKAMYSK